MYVRCLLALVVVSCHAPPAVRGGGIGETHVSAATAPAPAPRQPPAEKPAPSGVRELCGYAQLPSIPFERESVLVTPEEDVVIEKLSRCFTAPEMQSATIVLVGRAVTPVNPNCPAELALQRAERVKEFLVGHGVPTERILVLSAGDRETPTAIATPRVDFVLAFPKSAAQAR
jgi:hypothetical protein